MKLWLLRPIDPESELWVPWYEKAFGFVVRAETEEEARAFAQAEGGDETNRYNAEKIPAWTSPELSTCEELTPEGEAGVIIQDFQAA